MIRSFLLAAVTVLAFGAAHGADRADALKTYADTLAQQAQAAAAPAQPSTIVPDPEFGNTGMKSFWPPSTADWSSVEDGLRVLPWVRQVTYPGPPPATFPIHGGYYVLGRQQNAAGDRWRGWVARVSLEGTLDTTFGTAGWLYSDSADTIVDAAMANGRAYFLGNVVFGVPATRVICLDLASGDNCYSLLAGIQTWHITAATTHTGAYAQRLLHDSRYGLFIAARITDTTHGQLAGIARIDADTGGLITSFGDGGYYIGMSIAGHWTQNEISINDLAIPPQGTPGGTRLYAAGQGKRASGDHDAFTVAFDPVTGAKAINWDWHWYWINGTAFDNQKNAISALTVLDDGRLAYAGWTESTDSAYRPMYLGVVKPNGSQDATFCPGSSASLCLVDRRHDINIGGVPISSYVPHSLPVALSSSHSGHLIVAERFRDNGFNSAYPPINHVHQRVSEYTGTGNPSRVSTSVLDYPASTSTTSDGWWSRPFSMWVGGTGLWLGDEGAGQEVIAVAGTRKWIAIDFDATLGHLLLQSELLSDGFEGP